MTDLTKKTVAELRTEFVLRDNNMGNTVGVLDELCRRAEIDRLLAAPASPRVAGGAK